MSKFIFIAIFLLQFSGLSHATKLTEVLHNKVAIAPSKSFVVSVPTKQPIFVGWRVSKLNCLGNCIEAKVILDDESGSTIGAQHGASLKYKPVNGKVVIEYSNISDELVVIEIYTEQRICDSMACEYLQSKGIPDLNDYNAVTSDWKRVISKEVFSFETSKDGSYSVVRGSTVFGTEYELTIVWWLIDDEFPSYCKKWIPEKGTANLEETKAYQFNGSYTITPAPGIMFGVSCSSTSTMKREQHDL